jgi:hypothetical protein
MRTEKKKIGLDGRLPSGGLPFHLMDGLPLARGDLQSRLRAGPTSFDTGPPGWRIRPPVSDVDCRGSTPPKKTLRHRERCPDKVRTSTAICQTRTGFGSDCFVPVEPGLAITFRGGWSPPGRNGPVGTSPPFGQEGSLRLFRPTCVRAPWWIHYDEESRVGFRGSGPPISCNRHPDAVLTAEGSDQMCIFQILRPNGSHLRMTHSLGWKTINKSDYGDGENQCSVLELSEGKKFSRSENFGTPSFSLIANQTGDLFTIKSFS